MSNVSTYSSKSTAIRGLERAGIVKERANEFLVQVDGKWGFDGDAVTEALAKAKRGSGVFLSDTDKAQIAEEARNRAEGHLPKGITDSAKEQMTQDEIDADMAASFGYSECPACGIHLSNGVMDFDSLSDQVGPKKAYEMQKHEFSCMGCNAEWGPEIEAPKGKSEPTRHYINKSTVDGAVAMSHDIYNANPDLRRKDAIAKAVEAGIAFYTARTQYQKWFVARKSNKAK